MKAKTTAEPVYLVPTRDQVLDLRVGDLALDCFGKWSEVTRIYARGADHEGKVYVLFYVAFGDNGAVSDGYHEGQLVRTVPLCHLHTSRELDTIEASLR